MIGGVAQTMHICLIHNDYAAYSGEERAFEQLERALRARGHRVSWYRRSSRGLADSLAARAIAGLSGPYSLTARREFGRYLDEIGHVDLVHAQNVYPLITPSVLIECKARDIPVVLTCPNYRLWCPTGLHLRGGAICELCAGGESWHCVRYNCCGDLAKSAAYALRHSVAHHLGLFRRSVTRFIVLSEFQRQKFIDRGIADARLDVVPNIAPVVDVERPCQEEPVFGFVGRLSAEKGIEEFLKLARMLPDAVFEVAGNCSNASEIVRSAPPNVTFRGELDRRELTAFYFRCRAVVVPSICYETFSIVTLEAMSHGRPVIASRIGAIPEVVVDGETGLLVEPGDVQGLARGVTVFRDSAALAESYGRAGRKRAQREYSESRVYDQLLDVYSRALERGERR